VEFKKNIKPVILVKTVIQETVAGFLNWILNQATVVRERRGKPVLNLIGGSE
jgi:hypothetical protein